MPPVLPPLDPIDVSETLEAIERVEAHLLDTALRRLSLVRDGHAVDRPASGVPADVRVCVDRMNAEGVAVYGRLSRDVLSALMRTASHDYCGRSTIPCSTPSCGSCRTPTRTWRRRRDRAWACT